MAASAEGARRDDSNSKGERVTAEAPAAQKQRTLLNMRSHNKQKSPPALADGADTCTTDETRQFESQ
jgi:hypothetical protein